MSLSRNTVIAALLAVALAAFALAWVHMDLNRDSDMRSSEDAFYDRLKSGVKAGPSAPSRRAATPTEDPSLAAWYAESDEATEEENSGDASSPETEEAPPA